MPDSSVSRWLSSQPILRKHRPQLDFAPPAPSSPWAMAPSPSISLSDDDDVSFAVHSQPLFQPESPTFAPGHPPVRSASFPAKDSSSQASKDPYSSRTWTVSHPSSLTLTSPYASLESSPPLPKSLSQSQNRSSLLHSPPPSKYRCIHSSAASMYPTKDDSWLALSPPSKQRRETSLPPKDKPSEQRLSQSLKWRQFSSPSVEDLADKSRNGLNPPIMLEMSDVFTFSDDEEVAAADANEKLVAKNGAKNTAPIRTSPLAATAKSIQKSPKSVTWSSNNSTKPSNQPQSKITLNSVPKSAMSSKKSHNPAPITSHNNSPLVSSMPWLNAGKSTQPQTQPAKQPPSTSPTQNLIRLHPPSVRKAGSIFQQQETLAEKGPVKLPPVKDLTTIAQNRLTNGNSLSKSVLLSRNASSTPGRLQNIPRSQSVSQIQLSKMPPIRKSQLSSTQSQSQPQPQSQQQPQPQPQNTQSESLSQSQPSLENPQQEQPPRKSPPPQQQQQTPSALEAEIIAIASTANAPSSTHVISPVDILTSASPSIPNLSAEITVPPMDTIDPTQLVSAPLPDPDIPEIMDLTPSSLQQPPAKKSRLVNIRNNDYNSQESPSSLRRLALNSSKLKVSTNKQIDNSQSDIVVPDDDTSGSFNNIFLPSSQETPSSSQEIPSQSVPQKRRGRPPLRRRNPPVSSPTASPVNGSKPNTPSLRLKLSLPNILPSIETPTSPKLPPKYPSFTVQLHTSRFGGPPDAIQDMTLYTEMSEMTINSSVTFETPIHAQPPSRFSSLSSSTQPFMRGGRGSRGMRGTRGSRGGRGRGRGRARGGSTPRRGGVKRSSSAVGFDNDPFSSHDRRKRKRRRTKTVVDEGLENIFGTIAFDESAIPASMRTPVNNNRVGGTDVDMDDSSSSALIKSLMNAGNAEWSPAAILQAAGAASLRMQPNRHAKAIAMLKAVKNCVVEIKKLPRGPDGRPIFQGSAYNLDLQVQAAAGNAGDSSGVAAAAAATSENNDSGLASSNPGIDITSSITEAVKNVVATEADGDDNVEDRDYDANEDDNGDDSDESDLEPLSVSLGLVVQSNHNSDIVNGPDNLSRDNNEPDVQDIPVVVSSNALEEAPPIVTANQDDNDDSNKDKDIENSSADQGDDKDKDQDSDEDKDQDQEKDEDENSDEDEDSDVDIFVDKDKDKNKNTNNLENSGMMGGLPKFPVPLENEAAEPYPYPVLVQ